MDMDVIKFDWACAIEKIDGHVLKKTLDELRDNKTQFQHWPPTIPEFVAVAQNIARQYESAQPTIPRNEPSRQVFSLDMSEREQQRILLRETGYISEDIEDILSSGDKIRRESALSSTQTHTEAF